MKQIWTLRSLRTLIKTSSAGILLLGCSRMWALDSTSRTVVQQNSIPEALVPTTQDALWTGTIKDGETQLELFRTQGESVEWSPDNQWVAYDCKHQDGYYNIHVCRPDGTQDHCLTSLDNGLPHRHAGSPSWHPSGQYIAFAAEKKEHPGGSIEAIPGFGGHSDVWVMLADGSKAWQLTHTGDTKNDGVIIPKFSHDGTKLTWTERVGAPKILVTRAWFGEWVIKVADFKITPNGPEISNIRSLQPGGRAFYEGYGFSPDDRQIIFCSDYEKMNALKSQIYVMDALDGSHTKCLTPNSSYNEHASYSPDGKSVVWMSNEDNRNGGTDWWMMDADGEHPRRLTHFNQPGYPESCSHPVYAVLTHWALNGRDLLGGIQYSLIKQEGRIVLMTLSKDQ